MNAALVLSLGAHASSLGPTFGIDSLLSTDTFNARKPAVRGSELSIREAKTLSEGT